MNGVFEREDLIDELSLVIAPMVAAAEDEPLFMENTGASFTLIDVALYDDGVVCVKYGKKE